MNVKPDNWWRQTGGGETVGDTLKREYLPTTDTTASSSHAAPKSGIYTDLFAPSCAGQASMSCGCPAVKEEPNRWSKPMNMGSIPMNMGERDITGRYSVNEGADTGYDLLPRPGQGVGIQTM